MIEYVNGKTLDTVGRIPMTLLVSIFVKIAEGLVHMHRRNVLHADLKPNNVLLSRTGEVKIIDFGLAWIRGENKGRVQGTPEYMAPRQDKRGIVNEKTDIYNFGATMYRLTALRLPPTNAGGGDALLDSEAAALSSSRCRSAAGSAELAAPSTHCLAFEGCLKSDQTRRRNHGILDHLEEELGAPTAEMIEDLAW